MTKLTDVPASYYVGLPPGSDLDREKFPLAFATVSGTDAAALKRKNTVDEWARRSTYVGTYPDGHYRTVEGPRYEMENEWLTGFAFSSITSRSRTDNKVFDIDDPRGFSLQVYSDCMEDILLDAAIVKGEIQGECKWARSGGKMYLLVKDTPTHLEWEELQATKAAQFGDRIVPGDIVSQDGSGNYREIFIGNVYKLEFSFDEKDRGDRYSSWVYRSQTYPIKHEYVLTTIPDEKPWKATVNVKEDGSASSYYYLNTKRQWPKRNIKVGHDDELLARKLEELQLDQWRADMSRWKPTLYFSTLDNLRAYVAANGPTYQAARDFWNAEYEKHQDANHTYTLL